MTREVIHGSSIDFLVLGRAEILRIVPEEPHIVISITDPGAPIARIADAPARLGLLRLRFHDAETTQERRTLLSDEEAQAIVALVDQHREALRLIVCQCEGGISRSAGVAAALSRWLQNDNAEFFRHFQPNRHVYEKVLRAALAQMPPA
jgi:predicted protein tyrosine phosphatase